MTEIEEHEDSHGVRTWVGLPYCAFMVQRGDDPRPRQCDFFGCYKWRGAWYCKAHLKIKQWGRTRRADPIAAELAALRKLRDSVEMYAYQQNLPADHVLRERIQAAREAAGQDARQSGCGGEVTRR